MMRKEAIGMQRFILHSDANSFYASVEMLLNPDLRDKAVAVCGSVENRHGIVLAKSERAKKAGVKTGQANWEARQACPGLIIVPPQYDQYCKFSALLRNIYLRYSDEVESFGMDECWIDITRICSSFIEAERIANEIRISVKTELGVTVSIGVSFNKILAKLGSDMKKPDAVTVLDDATWREKVWPLAASEILYVGRATTRKLAKYGVNTIGDLARTEPDILHSWFGKNGLALWVYANGLDQSRVMPVGFSPEVKSVGHGITCSRDLLNADEVWYVMLELSQDIGHRLRKYHLAACGVQVYVRNHDLYGEQYQMRLPYPTQSPMEVAQAARLLFGERYQWISNVRAVTVRAINLVDINRPIQLDFFGDWDSRLRQQRLDDCIDQIRGRFGNRAIVSASLLTPVPIPNDDRDMVRMPGLMYA